VFTFASSCVSAATVASFLSDGLVARGRRTLHQSLFFLSAQPLLHSLTGSIGKFLAGGLYDFVGVLMNRVAEKTDLLSVAETPFAEQKMNPKADALENGQFVIQRLGLKTAGLLAIR
jgi:hypothetical protein